MTICQISCIFSQSAQQVTDAVMSVTVSAPASHSWITELWIERKAPWWLQTLWPIRGQHLILMTNERPDRPPGDGRDQGQGRDRGPPGDQERAERGESQQGSQGGAAETVTSTTNIRQIRHIYVYSRIWPTHVTKKLLPLPQDLLNDCIEKRISRDTKWKSKCLHRTNHRYSLL